MLLSNKFKTKTTSCSSFTVNTSTIYCTLWSVCYPGYYVVFKVQKLLNDTGFFYFCYIRTVPILTNILIKHFMQMVITQDYHNQLKCFLVILVQEFPLQSSLRYLWSKLSWQFVAPFFQNWNNLFLRREKKQQTQHQ